MNTKHVLEILAEQGLLDAGQSDEIMREVLQTGKSLVEVLVDFQICNEAQLYNAIATFLGTDYVDLTGFEPPPEVVRLLPAGIALLHRAFPLGVESGNIQVALADPLNPQTAEDI